MTLKPAARSAISPFIVMDVMRAANEREAAGGQVLHLEVGQPATPAPAAVIEAARRGLGDDRIGYTEAFGLPDLRRRIAGHYRETYGVRLDPARVAVTTGSSGGFLLGFLAAFDPGDRVALAAPGYPAYRNILQALGNEPVLLPSEAEHRFQPTPALLDKVEGRLDGLILASPSNPTGTMVDRAHLRALVDYCAERGIRLVSDEIYHGICYGEAAVSALELTDRAIVINSFSKYFSMTGWRLGWMVLPEDLLRPVECLAQNLFISPPTLSQLAGIAAFECRAVLAGGAFYSYADVGRLTNDSEDFCRRMLAEAGVAATPGVDFDPDRGHRFVRFSFAGSEADMAQAASRLQDWLGQRA